MDIAPTLNHLLTRHDPFICLVKGQWGVGKTYFIKAFIRENCASIVKQNFSYVSLFGMSSTDELLQEIFVNSVPTKTLNAKTDGLLSTPTDESLKERANYLIGRVKPLLNRLGNIPLLGVNNARGFVVGNLANFFNRNSLIVVDDLERHSASLPIRDILGVLTQLKEEKGCQIIIVMNEDVLQKDGSDAAYFETKEKVIDRELVFQPTVEDAIKIGLNERDKNKAAADACLKLQIGNIRTIQKIDSALSQLRESLASLQIAIPETFDQQIQTTTVLAAWAYWERVIDIDELERMELGDSTMVDMEEMKGRYNETQKTTYQHAHKYGYTFSDETDKLLIRFLKTGALDPEELRQRVQENDAAVAKRKRDDAMEQAWEVYRGTLQPNVDEVVNALYEAHVAGIEDVQNAHIGQAVWVLRELGAEDKADDLTQRFLGRSHIDTFSSYPFTGLIQDKKFLDAWREHTEKEVRDERTLEETISSYYFDKSHAVEDFKRLAEFSEDEYYDWFKTTTNNRVIAMADALARNKYRLPSSVEEIAKIERDVRAALRRISAEDKINEVRLRHILQNDAGQQTNAPKAAG